MKKYLLSILSFLFAVNSWGFAPGFLTTATHQGVTGGGGPTISYVATGTVAGGATPTAPTPGFPSGIQANDLLVLAVENKYPTNSPATPTGWTLGSNCQGTGGAGTANNDAGSTYSTVFYKKAIGNESGTQTVAIAAANSSRAAIVAYRPTAGHEIIPVCTNGSYAHTATTAWSVTGAADPGFASGDWALVSSANNSDLAASFSAQALSASGFTFGSMTERVDSVETQGQDSSLVVADFAAGTGTSSAAPVYTMTGATNGTNTPAGASVIARLRPTADTTAPTMSASLPSATVACPADPTAVTIGVTTNEAADCKWSTSDVAYASMENSYSTGQGAGVHTASVGNLACEATGTYYTRCIDTASNANSTSNTHNVTMAAESAGPSVVNSTVDFENSDSNFPKVLTLPATTAGNTILVTILNDSASTTTYTITDNQSSTYTQVATVTTADPYRYSVFRATNVAAGVTSVTIDPSSYYVGLWMAAVEMTGTAGSADGMAAIGYTYSSGATTPALTTTNAADVVFGMVRAQDPSRPHTSSDCTTIFDYSDPQGTWFLAYKAVTSTGSHSCTWTNTGGDSAQHQTTWAVGQ